jgi:NNP family nitrate/nitrite transporter-like MFS transporter
MEQSVSAKSHQILFINTLAFTVCFAVWMLNGVLVTFLVEHQIYKWSTVQIAWLMAIPPLAGSIFRLHAGIWTDKYGGKITFAALLFLCAIPMFLLSKVDSFLAYALCSFGFGLAGQGFSIGIAYTSVWYPKSWQGRALGIFGVGNAGAAVTTMLAPTLLKHLTADGTNLEGWRDLPKIYAAALIIMGVLFLLFAVNKKSPAAAGKTFVQMLAPLKEVRVWRFGLYYYLVFGCFVALSQWLVPYFLNMYAVSLVTAGIFASIFSLPAGLLRALGGWMSDKMGARTVMYWVLGLSVVFCLLLVVPKMEIDSPGKGVMARRAGTVTEISSSLIRIDELSYPLIEKPTEVSQDDQSFLVFPTKKIWQEPMVKLGEVVQKKQLIARGTTHIYFQANIWIAASLVFIIGTLWGIGKAAVYKHIPDYFPNDVGAVGGMVGLLGGLGGFVSPLIFGYLLEWTGLWTSMWIFLFLISAICLTWMHATITKMRDKAAPQTAEKFESEHA